MAEATIGHLIEELRFSTQAQIDVADANTSAIQDELISISNQFGDYFDMLKQQRLDDLEDKREAKAKKKVDGGKGFLAGAESDSLLDAIGSIFRGFGFLALLGGVAGAIAGTFIGYLEGIRNTLKLVDRKFLGGNLVKLSNRFVDVARGIRQSFSFGLNNINSGVRGIDGQFRKLNFLDKVSKSIGASIRVITSPLEKLSKFMRGADDAADGVKKTGGFFQSIGNFVKRFTSVPEISDSLADLRKFFAGFGDMLKGVKTATAGPFAALGNVGSVFKPLMATLKPFFSAFRTLGRFLGGPVTMIIFGAIDAVMGFVKGFQSTEGNIVTKLFMGINGAISGIISGFVGGIADLGKMIVGFIAGLFGFDSFKEKLASFSFQDMLFDALMFGPRKLIEFLSDPAGFIADIGQSLADGFTFLVDYIKGIIPNSIKAIGGTVGKIFSSLNPFSSDEPEAPDMAQPESNLLNKMKKENAQRNVSPIEFSKSRVEQLERRKAQGNLSSRQADELERRRRDIDRMEKQASGAQQVNAVNAPTTVNNNSNTAVYSDPSPATDDLDRASMAW